MIGITVNFRIIISLNALIIMIMIIFSVLLVKYYVTYDDYAPASLPEK